MTSSDPLLRDAPEKSAAHAAAQEPRIVNGLTVRPRKQVDSWHLALCFLPLLDIVALAVLLAVECHRLSRYLATRRA
jgi:hypothetical protein